MTSAPATFRDDATEQRYRTDGYAVVPFLDPDEVRELEAAYWDEVAGADDGLLAIDYLRPDRAIMQRVRELASPLWERHLPALFCDHRVVFSTFVVKHPGHGSEMFLHEDRSWVDERRFRSGTLWIPLVDDMTDENGPLRVIPGSHRLASNWSGSLTPDLIRPYEAWLRERLVPLAAPAGSAVYYDSRTLHASPPNLSERPRVALVLGVVPRDAQLLHVVATGTTRRALYAVDPDYFIRTGPRESEARQPDGELIEEVDEVGPLSPALLAAVLGEDPPPPAPVVPADAAAAPDGGWRPLVPEQVGVDPGPATLRIEPGGRLRVPAAGDRDGFGELIDVVEAAPVGTGIAAGPLAVNLLPGERYRTPSGPLVIWNDGPGALVLAGPAAV